MHIFAFQEESDDKTQGDDDKLGVDGFSYQSTHFVSLDPATALPAATMHLLLVWGALLAIIVALGFVIAFFLKRKDVHV